MVQWNLVEDVGDDKTERIQEESIRKQQHRASISQWQQVGTMGTDEHGLGLGSKGVSQREDEDVDDRES